MSESTPRRPAFIPSVCYKDGPTALKWLEAAFGFKISEVLTDKQGKIVHAEMTHGDGVIMVGNEWADWTRSPASVGGVNTQCLCVCVDDADAHCARARAAGAKIVEEPKTNDYGDDYWADRSYRAEDPEGHQWWFMQRVRDQSPRAK